MARQEFSKPVKVEIIKRATRDGVVYCEGCGLPTRRFQIDHTIADALRVDKTRKLTADDGRLLCQDAGRQSCHGRKTAEQDVPAIAKAKRIEAAHLGAKTAPTKTIQSRGFAKSEKALRRAEKAERMAANPLPPSRMLQDNGVAI
ncbi:MAG TPA: hypothetical protein VEF90_17780 [Xanthobacteraceae bacterium]|nr:hypothetical protein [Xanthobacteraceae bacterium]